MNLLWIATKPPCPPIDGGRLLQMLTLEALASRGVRATVVAPVDRDQRSEAVADAIAAFATPHLVPCPPPGWLSTLVGARPGGLPLAIARHRRASVRSAVAGLLDKERFAVVHAEQVHALPQASPAAERGLPVIVRAQNVESDLWRAVAERAGLGRLRSAAAAIEARRLAAWEGRAVTRVSATVALTSRDAARLEELGGACGDGTEDARVVLVPAPFPEYLPPADRSLPGSPAVVLVGSGGWVPNLDATRWFLNAVWPVIHRALPAARLHVFGDPSGGADGGREPGAGRDQSVVRHPPPAESREAFATGSVLVVPLRIASGVRMKILEAWARGVPVVATPEAAAGLRTDAGRALLLAASPEEFAAALSGLADQPGLAADLVTGGRRALASHHRPDAVADRLVALYERCSLSSAATSARLPRRSPW